MQTEATMGIEVDLIRETEAVSSYDQGWWAGYCAARLEFDTEIRYLEMRVSRLMDEIREIAHRDDDGEDRSC
jgi:hypothetical protein